MEFASYQRDANSKTAALPKMQPGQTQTSWIKDGQVIVVQSIVFKGSPTGTVFIRSDLREMYDRLEHYAGIIIVVLAGSLVAAFGDQRMSQRADF